MKKSDLFMRKEKLLRRKKLRKIKKIIIFIFTLLVSSIFFLKVVNNTDKLYTDGYKKTGALINESEDKDKVINEIEKDKSEEVKKLDNSGYLTLEDDVNADDASVVLPETMYKGDFYRNDGKKIAYLTFDDGPSSKSTEKILNILKKKDIKATFFVLGLSIENNNEAERILKRMIKEGHAIGSHGYSHNYSKLYPNKTIDVKALMNDFKKNANILKNILGEDFYTRVIRLPGGYFSWNGTKKLDIELKKNNLWKVDWNALNGDAEALDSSKETLLSNLKETVGNKDVAVILMHDTDQKKGTVESLQNAIDFLKSKGFEFRTLK